MDVFELVAKLRLDSTGYKADLKSAADETSKLTKASKGLQMLNRGVDKMLKVGAVAAGAAVAGMTAFAKASVQTGMQFDTAMSQVAATMGTTVDQIGELRDFAQKMGATTAFSATQAAEALNYMALAGYDADTSMKMLPNVLNLAAAGSMDLARASDMVTDAQTALGLTTEQTSEMVDQMAKTASKTNTSVSQLGDAMLTIGATARNLKGGTVELSTVLGVLADNGIKGAEGGTHLRNAILSLQTPTKDGAAALEKLGMSYESMYDSAGNMRSLPEIFQQMSTAMEGMDQASKDAIISGIFNKTDLASINALVGTSASRWTEVETAIRNSKGAAEEMAATQLDNLAGDITLMKSAAEGAKIAFSDGLTPAIRNTVQMITKYLSKGSTQKALNDLGKKVGELAQTLTGKLLNALPRIMKLFDDGGKKIKIAGAAFAAFAIAVKAAVNPVGALITALTALGGAFALSELTADTAKRKFSVLTDEQYRNVEATLDTVDAYQDMKKSREDTYASIDAEAKKTENLWNKLQGLVDANGNIIEGNEEQVQSIADLLNAAGIEIDIVDGKIQKYDELANSIENVIQKRRAEAKLAAAEEGYNDAVKNLPKVSEAIYDVGREVDAAQGKVNEFSAKLAELNSVDQSDATVAANNQWDIEKTTQDLLAANAALAERQTELRNLEATEGDMLANVSQYEEAYAEATNENWTAVNETLDARSKERYRNLVATNRMSSEELSNLIRDTGIAVANAERMTQRYAEGQAGVTEEAVNEAIQAAEEMTNLLDQAKDVDDVDPDIKIEDNANDAKSRIQALKTALDNLPTTKEIKIYETTIKRTQESDNAIGLDYVPHNKYLAELHRGEAVLTAREADEWRRGNSDNGNGGGTTINQYIETVPQSPVEIAAATAAMFEQARWAVA